MTCGGEPSAPRSSQRPTPSAADVVDRPGHLRTEFERAQRVVGGDHVVGHAGDLEGEADVLVNWPALGEPDLTAGPGIEYRDRVLAVGRGHRLAGRASVQAEDLADEQTHEPACRRCCLG
jgi:hypothetical protein